MPEAVRIPGTIVSGPELVVGAGGRIKVISAGGGGGIVGSGGSRASHITNRSVTLATGGQTLATKHNAAIATLASGMNTILTALRNVGILATS